MTKIKVFFLKKNNILFIHPIKEFSGSLKSLEQYLKLLKKEYNFTFLVPSGIASNRLKIYGNVVNVPGLSKFDNSQIGYYRGLRWFLLFREFIYLFPTFMGLFYLKKTKKIDIIHFNEITLLPTIYICKLFFNVPYILHCRTLFKKNNYIGKMIGQYLKRNIFQIIAIDTDVKNSLPNFLNVKIIRNIYIEKAKIKNKSKNKILNIGYLGSFLKYKGIEDLIIVVNKLTLKGYNVKLHLAGNFIKSNFIFELFGLTNNIDKRLLNNGNFVIYGHLNNLDQFYNNIDILCFPSYLNSLGRQVIEASYYKIPSIVCLKNDKSDCFVNKKTGLSYKIPGSNNKLENILKYFYLNRHQISKMGKYAYKIVSKNFNVINNLKLLKSIYKSSINVIN